MKVQSTRNDWWELAPCKGTGPWVWDDRPSKNTEAERLAVCETCAVTKSCAEDLVKSGDQYPYQIRGGLRLWVSADRERLPDPEMSTTRCETCRRNGIPPSQCFHAGRLAGRPSTFSQSTIAHTGSGYRRSYQTSTGDDRT